MVKDRMVEVEEMMSWPQWEDTVESSRWGGGGSRAAIDRCKDLLYLQENYMVTDGVFLDENIIFDDVTPEWKDFCTHVLKFEVPVYETVKETSSNEEKPTA